MKEMDLKTLNVEKSAVLWTPLWTPQAQQPHTDHQAAPELFHSPCPGLLRSRVLALDAE